MQTATVSAIRETAKGRCKVVLGKFHQGIAEVHCLPHSLDLPLQRCCAGYWLPWTLSLSPLLSRNFRETFAKNPLQINRKIHTLNRGWGFSQLHLITIYIVLGCLGSILYLPKQFRGSSLHLGKSEIKPLKPPHQDKRSLFLSSNKHLFSQAQEKMRGLML